MLEDVRQQVQFVSVVISVMIPLVNFVLFFARRVQDGPKIVLVRSFFRLVVRDRFFGRLGVALGSFLVVLGSS